MRGLSSVTLAGVLFLTVFAQTGTVAQSGVAVPPQLNQMTVAPRSAAELRESDALIAQMVQSRDLFSASVADDAMLAGRRHETLMQFYRGVPLYGGSVTRQMVGATTVSMLGTIYTDIDVDPSPGFAVADAAVTLRQVSGRELAFGVVPSLVILPTLTGRYVLAYRATMTDETTYFIDARTGDLLRKTSERRNQGQVGVGTGVLGDRKKMSTTQVGDMYRTLDQLRPFGIHTLDTRGNSTTLQRLLELASPNDTDFSTDGDNSWSDARVVDAHVHSGWTTDYLFKQFQWNGFDGAGSRLFTLVHRALANNAFFTPPPFGPGRGGAIVLGDTSGGVPITSLDVTAHEIMHGVTEFSLQRRTGTGLLDVLYIDRLGPTSFTFNNQTFPCTGSFLVSGGVQFPFLCDAGRYVLTSNHPGAVNEAFSDVIGTGTEFFYHPAGSGTLKADYVIGEDVAGWGPIRSLSNPASLTATAALPFPDHASQLLSLALIITRGTVASPTGIDLAPLTIVGNTGLLLNGVDNGGVHWNATVLGHAFHLAVEGGRNATSNRTVQGVGPQNRAQVERAFFRAMTQLMPSGPNLPTAAFAVYQAAVDLYGANSAAARAIADAMIATGLLLPSN